MSNETVECIIVHCLLFVDVAVVVDDELIFASGSEIRTPNLASHLSIPS